MQMSHTASMSGGDVSQMRGGTGVYQRQAGEYVRPETPLEVVSWDEARDVPLYESGELSGKPFYWGGVRGSQYVDGSLWPYALNVEHELWGELVPEPFNPYDDTAVAIDVDGIRAGYMSRVAAGYIHRDVAALVATGHRVLTPVRLSIVPSLPRTGLQINAFAAFPTFKTTDRLLPSRTEYSKILAPIWEQLGEGVRQQIAADGFHLAEGTLAAVVALRDLAPRSGLTEHTHLRSVPRGVELFLESKRHQYGREKQRREEAERIDQLRRMAKLRREGHTYIEIGKREGIAPSTVSNRLKAEERRKAAAKSNRSKHGATTRKPLSSSTARTMLMLHENGWTIERLAKDHRREVAEIKAALSQASRQKTK